MRDFAPSNKFFNNRYTGRGSERMKLNDVMLSNRFDQQGSPTLPPVNLRKLSDIDSGGFQSGGSGRTTVNDPLVPADLPAPAAPTTPSLPVLPLINLRKLSEIDGGGEGGGGSYQGPTFQEPVVDDPLVPGKPPAPPPAPPTPISPTPTGTYRPTGQDLIGMTPGQIGGIFGKDIAGFTEEGFAAKYGMYIPQYNRGRESIRREQFGQQRGALGLGVGQTLEQLFSGGRQALGRTGFAGSGAIEQGVRRGRRGALQEYQSRLGGLKLGLGSDVERYQAEYESDVYGALETLAGLEAFTPGAYKGTGPKGGDTKTDPDTGETLHFFGGQWWRSEEEYLDFLREQRAGGGK